MNVIAVTPVIHIPVVLGEGPRYYRGHLYWVDLLGGVFFRYDPATGENTAFSLGKMIGSFAPMKDGRFLMAAEDGFYFWSASDGLELIHPINEDQPEIRFNDGACDPAGRFWGGTMELDCKKDQGQMYLLDQQAQLHDPGWPPTSCPNGIDWSLDGKTLYFIDSPHHSLYAFDYDVENGVASNRRRIIEFSGEPVPDGMTLDLDGNLWIGIWDGFRVECWNPSTGEKLTEIPVPVGQVTACAFGGPDMRTLYITTGNVNLTEQQQKDQPLAGALFSCIPGPQGREAQPFTLA